MGERELSRPQTLSLFNTWCVEESSVVESSFLVPSAENLLVALEAHHMFLTAQTILSLVIAHVFLRGPDLIRWAIM